MKRRNSPADANAMSCFFVELSGKVFVSVMFALLYVHCKTAEGSIIQRPTDAIVIVNHSTSFNCSKSKDKSTNISDELTWYHQPLGGVPAGVYEDGKIRDKYSQRFSISRQFSSDVDIYDLLVQRPESKDSGKYQCVEDVLEGTGPSAELIVLDSNLICEPDKDLNNIVGPTECDKHIEPDEIQLICSVTYSGNIPPQLEWRRVGSELELNTIKCDVRGNRVMCNATLEVGPNLDGAVYVCQVKSAEQYNCSRKVNKIIYASSDNTVRAITTAKDEICSANTSVNLPCSYKWYKGNTTEQSGQTLKLSKTGKYTCKAECTIRNQACVFTAMVINFSEPAMSSSDTSNYNLAWLVLLLIPLVAAVVLLVYCIRKKPKQEPSTPPRDNQELLMADSHATDEDDLDDAIREIYATANDIGKGLCDGQIRGPMHYKGKECACERIMCKLSPIADREVEADKLKTAKGNIRSNFYKWRTLQHVNLIKMYEVIIKSQVAYITTEYAAGGSIRDELKKRKVDLPMTEVKNWATQIAKGMKYLHEEGIIYKNLNSVQILIMEQSEEGDVLNKTLKISQFCLIEDNAKSTKREEKCAFMAPEVFNGTYVKEGDVWSFGIVIWEMLTRRVPYEEEKTPQKIISDINKGATVLKIQNSCDKALEKILIDCRILNHPERPSFKDIVKRLQAWRPEDPPV